MKTRIDRDQDTVVGLTSNELMELELTPDEIEIMNKKRESSGKLLLRDGTLVEIFLIESLRGHEVDLLFDDVVVATTTKSLTRDNSVTVAKSLSGIAHESRRREIMMSSLNDRLYHVFNFE